MDNLYDHKRMKDPMYSDLFDQCLNSGGKRPSPIRKKAQEITSVQVEWNNRAIEAKVKRDYSGYRASEQKLREF